MHKKYKQSPHEISTINKKHVGRDVKPEPAFCDPTGAGAVKLLRLQLQTKLQKSFLNCREYLFGKYICRMYIL